MSRSIKSTDSFQKRLLKYLPSESIATYLACVNIIPRVYQDSTPILIIVIAVITLATPFYLTRFMDMSFKKDLVNILMISLSFIVWAFSVNGEIWLKLDPSVDFIKALILVLWTFIVPLVLKKKNE